MGKVWMRITSGLLVGVRTVHSALPALLLSCKFGECRSSDYFLLDQKIYVVVSLGLVVVCLSVDKAREFDAVYMTTGDLVHTSGEEGWGPNGETLAWNRQISRPKYSDTCLLIM
jgi:hypothetical protein